MANDRKRVQRAIRLAPNIGARMPISMAAAGRSDAMRFAERCGDTIEHGRHYMAGSGALVRVHSIVAQMRGTKPKPMNTGVYA